LLRPEEENKNLTDICTMPISYLPFPPPPPPKKQIKEKKKKKRSSSTE
jgi:hypothetical protein